MKHPILKWVLSLIVPSALISLWFILFWEGPDVSWVTDPLKVLQRIGLDREIFFWNSLYSLAKLLIGVSIGAVLGVTFALLMARLRIMERLFGPTLVFLSAVPFVVFVPYLMMVFGISGLGLFRYAVVASAVFLIVSQQVLAATKAIPLEQLELCALLEKSWAKVVFSVLLPAVLPRVMEAVRFSLLFAWLAVAIAEKAYAEADGGVGYLLLNAREQGQFELATASALIMAVLAFCIDYFVGYLDRKINSWHYREYEPA